MHWAPGGLQNATQVEEMPAEALACRTKFKDADVEILNLRMAGNWKSMKITPSQT